MIKNILLVTFAAILLSGCGGKKGDAEWTAFIYPDKQNTKRSLKSPMTFPTFEICKEETIKQMEIMKITTVGSFKCGLNCEFHDGMKLEVCESMLDANGKNNR